MSEGFRIALTPQFPHMPFTAIYGGLAGFTVILGWLGVQGFKSRVLA
jgi:hypothetical protein